MDALRKLLDSRPTKEPARGTLGAESDWLPFKNISCVADKFLVCDFQFVPSVEDGFVVEVERGKYGYEAKVLDFDGDKRVSRVRVVRGGSKPERGKILGETWTDTGRTGVCDLEQITSEWNSAADKKAADKLMEEYERGNSCGVFRLSSSGTPIPYVSSGFGDGTFPVMELLEDGKRVGFEIEFIKNDEPYPFGTKPVSKLLDQLPRNPERKQNLLESLSNVFTQLAKEKTGDRQVDRKRMEEPLHAESNRLAEGLKTAVAEMKKHIQQVRRKALPWHLELTPTNEKPLLKDERVQHRFEALKAAGFLEVGCFQMNTGLSSFCFGFVHPSGRRASLHISGKQVILTVILEFRDGRIVEFTESRAVIERPPWSTAVSRPDIAPVDLIQLSSSAVTPEVKPATLYNYVGCAKESWQRHMTWRIDRGGMTLQEVKNLFKIAEGDAEQAKAAAIRRDQIEKAMTTWFIAQSEPGFITQQHLDDLIIIHDELTAEELAHVWWAWTGDISVKEAEFKSPNGREAFAEVNRRHGDKLQLVRRKTGGFQADFYFS